MSVTIVDARNLLCPLPVIRTQDSIMKLQQGDTLEVLCTDPGVLHDIPAWCQIHGHEVCAVDEREHEIIFLIRVG